MNLNTYRFYCGGDTAHFSIFSDGVCRACYLESIPVPFGETRVDFYTIEPSPLARWVVITQKDGEDTRCKWFLRNGDEFVEYVLQDIPQKLSVEIIQKFPYLAQHCTTKVA